MSLSAFFKGNEKQEDVVNFVVSNRFLDENGKPEVWKLKAISGKKETMIKQKCTFKYKNTKEMDWDRYTLLLTAESVVYPNLSDKSLQDSYGVMGVEDLLLDMLHSGELNKLKLKAQEVNGYGDSMDDMVEEAKN
ncbi:MAG: phage portal protein [Clostridiales bacterium]|nr:phage portal protein [Clostridiales bacterium]